MKLRRSLRRGLTTLLLPIAGFFMGCGNYYIDKVDSSQGKSNKGDLTFASEFGRNLSLEEEFHRLEIYTSKKDGSNLTMITDNEIADLNPDWSLDGKKIAYVGGTVRMEGRIVDGKEESEEVSNFSLRVYNLESERFSEFENSKYQFNTLSTPDFGPSDQIVINTRENELLIIPYENGFNGSENLVFTSEKGNPLYFPMWSPNGEMISFYEDNKGITVVNPNGEKLLDLEDIKKIVGEDVETIQLYVWGKDNVLYFGTYSENDYPDTESTEHIMEVMSWKGPGTLDGIYKDYASEEIAIAFSPNGDYFLTMEEVSDMEDYNFYVYSTTKGKLFKAYEYFMYDEGLESILFPLPRFIDDKTIIFKEKDKITYIDVENQKTRSKYLEN